jgi:hypothetical protein
MIAEAEHKKFVQRLEEGDGKLVISKHALRRQSERAISEADIRNAVLNGWPIQRRQDGGFVTIVLLYFLKVGKGQYRPIHVVCVFHVYDPDIWTVKTTYDPRSGEWRDNYQRRK